MHYADASGLGALHSALSVRAGQATDQPGYGQTYSGGGGATGGAGEDGIMKPVAAAGLSGKLREAAKADAVAAEKAEKVARRGDRRGGGGGAGGVAAAPSQSMLAAAMRTDAGISSPSTPSHPPHSVQVLATSSTA